MGEKFSWRLPVNLLEWNEKTAAEGLALQPAEAMALVEARRELLQRFGRFELGGGTLEKLVETFCDSPYFSQENKVELLHGLLELFYYLKNETLDQVGDEELLSKMKQWFDGVCAGSIELLAGTMLEEAARAVRYGGGFALCTEAGEEDESDA